MKGAQIIEKLKSYIDYPYCSNVEEALITLSISKIKPNSDYIKNEKGFYEEIKQIL